MVDIFRPLRVFGDYATGVGLVNGHRTAFGARYIEQALLRLKPGGRLVEIVGCGMALERPAVRRWWNATEQRYHVRANVGMDGREYAKFGTTFDNQIIVIDHTGPTAHVSAIITGRSLSVREALLKLNDLSKEDVYERVSQHDHGGVVAVSGQTPTRSAKCLCIECCRRVAGVIRVIDNVQIEPAVNKQPEGVLICKEIDDCGKRQFDDSAADDKRRCVSFRSRKDRKRRTPAASNSPKLMAAA